MYRKGYRKIFCSRSCQIRTKRPLCWHVLPRTYVPRNGCFMQRGFSLRFEKAPSSRELLIPNKSSFTTTVVCITKKPLNTYPAFALRNRAYDRPYGGQSGEAPWPYRGLLDQLRNPSVWPFCTPQRPRRRAKRDMERLVAEI